MSNGQRMIREVTSISPLVREAVGCLPCGLAIAVDIVDERYGNARVDWQKINEKHHHCKLTEAGLSEAQLARIAEIVATLPAVDATEAVAPAPAEYVDSRQPVERDVTWDDDGKVST